jgi:hypothetical protein
VILLKSVVQIATCPVPHVTAKLCPDCPGIGIMAVRGDPIRGYAGHRLCRSKEDLGGGKVAVLTQHHVDLGARAIDRAIQIPPAESGKTLVFLTNQFGLPAATICALYKSRWQVELFFKWIKQHLRIKRFFGTSENAVKTQIWIAVSVYVLVAIVKKRLNLDASLYTLLQILSVTLFEKIPISQALAQDDSKCSTSQITNQLNLFAY